jgi:hypothetical protein
MMFKVDFHKAFDTVLWDHLDEVMGYMRFGNKWRRLIYECLSTSQLSFLVNGSPTREFRVGRGIRQGDPLSPFLFNITVKGLLVLFHLASTSSMA